MNISNTFPFTRRKIAGVICTALAGVNSIFFAEYKYPNRDEEPHIFTPLQQWIQTQKKQWFSVNEQQQQSIQVSDTNSAAVSTDTNNTADAAATSNVPSYKHISNHQSNISELQRIAKGHR
jgi:hypothetical protein